MLVKLRVPERAFAVPALLKGTIMVLVPLPADFWTVPELLKTQPLPPLVVSAVPFCWMSNTPVVWLFSVEPLSRNRVLKLEPGVVWVMVPALFSVPFRIRLPVPLRVMKPLPAWLVSAPAVALTLPPVH